MNQESINYFKSQEAKQVIIFNFLKYNKGTNEERQEAESQVAALQTSNVIGTIFCCASIILDDDITDMSVYFFSMLTIRHCFTPSGRITEDKIAPIWLQQEEEINTTVKKAIFRGLMFQQENIRNLASTSFALLLNIEKKNMFPMIDHIYSLIDDPSTQDYIKASAIDVLAQISSPHSLGGHTNVTEVQEILANMFIRVGMLLQQCKSFSVDYKINVVQVVISLLDVASVLFQREDIVNDLVNHIIQLMSSIPNNKDQKSGKLHFLLSETLIKITKVNYFQKDFDFSRIGIYTTDLIKEMNILDVNQFEKLSNLMQFWTSLAEFEYKIIQKNNYITKYNRLLVDSKKEIKPKGLKSCMFLCLRAIKELMPRLLDILTVIDASNQDSEDVSVKEPHMFATCLIEIFYKIDQESVFNTIRQIWDKTSLFKQNWTFLHALLLSAAIIAKKPKHNIIFDFFTNDKKYFNEFILTALDTSNNRLKDTALFTIMRIIKNYPEILTEDIFNSLHKWIMLNKNHHDPIIMTRIILVVEKLIKCSNRDLQIHSVIFSKFNDWVELYYIVATRPDAIQTDLFRISSYIMSGIIQYSRKMQSGEYINNIAMLLRRFNNDLRNIIDNQIDEAVYTRQQQLIYLICNIYMFYYRDVVDYVTESADLFFMLMNQQSAIFEEALAGFYTIVMAMRDFKDHDFDNKYVVKIDRYISMALNSGSPSITTNSTFALGVIYKCVFGNEHNRSPYLVSFLQTQTEATTQLILNCLRHEFFTREFYPPLLEALANVIMAAKDFFVNRPPIVDELLNEYARFSNFQLSGANKNDRQYSNSLFKSIFMGYTAILNCISSEDSRVSNKNFMKTFIDIMPKKLYKMDDYLSDEIFTETLMEFCHFLNAYNSLFNVKGNILLNRLVNYMIVFHARCSKNMALKNEADKTFSMMIKA